MTGGKVNQWLVYYDSWTYSALLTEMKRLVERAARSSARSADADRFIAVDLLRAKLVSEANKVMQ